MDYLVTFRANIEDVAKAAGVSVATVSRVVNKNYPYIGEGTREKVLEAIQKLHYTPNRLIRSLQAGRTKVIAYASLYPGLFRQDEVQVRTLVGIYGAAKLSGYDILLPTDPLLDNDQPRVENLLDGRCDGVILETPKGSPVLDILAARKFPTVVLGNRYVPAGIGTVYGDYRDGTRQAIKHFLDQGHRRIAHLAGPIQLWDEAQCRLDTYLETLKEAGIPIDRDLILPSWGTETWAANQEEVDRSLDTWLRLPCPPTAVFCSSDRLALALMEAAGHRGLKIPEDLSIIGFDDMPTASHCQPALTTVSIDQNEMARAAMELLHALIEKRFQPPDSRNQEQNEPVVIKKILPAKLVIRESTKRFSINEDKE
jgi:DNA-binding LacI/PurR family transcriptional regulator